MDTPLYYYKPSHESNESNGSVERTALGRLPDRGHHDRATVDAILDEALVAHVGMVTERGPIVLPMTYGRDGDWLYLHGAPASRFLRHLKRGVDVCVTVTLLDGLVLARSTFHHSMNYRSVVLFGTATEVTDLDERAAALEAIVEHIVPGRTSEARPGDEKEVRGTSVLRIGLDQASAKIRTGPPIDDEADLELPWWGGVLPLTTVVGAPVPDDHVRPGTEVPASVRDYRRPVAAGNSPARSAS